MRWKSKQYLHKFKNKSVIDKGERYASKLEHRYKNYLELLKINGDVIFYLTQVPLRLPGGTKYIVDFLVFYENGSIEFVDTKGVETDTFKIKKREIEAIYPFEIKVVKKGDF
jgi:hypothetical protein